MTWTSTPKGLYGESGIRTHGTLASTHAFQAWTLGHSVISPRRGISARARWPPRVPVPDKELAERVGFEPTEPQAAQRFSRPPDSTALASLRFASTGPDRRTRVRRDRPGIIDWSSAARLPHPADWYVPKRIRTSGLWIRNPMLYPAELWAPV